MLLKGVPHVLSSKISTFNHSLILLKILFIDTGEAVKVSYYGWNKTTETSPV